MSHLFQSPGTGYLILWNVQALRDVHKTNTSISALASQHRSMHMSAQMSANMYISFSLPVCTARFGGGGGWLLRIMDRRAKLCKATDGSKSGWRHRSVVVVAVVIVVAM